MVAQPQRRAALRRGGVEGEQAAAFRVGPGRQTGLPDEYTTVEDVEALARAVLSYLADIPQIPAYC